MIRPGNAADFAHQPFFYIGFIYSWMGFKFSIHVYIPKILHDCTPSQTPLQSPSSNSSVGDLLGDFSAAPTASNSASAPAADGGGDLWGDFTSASPAVVKSSGNWEQFWLSGRVVGGSFWSFMVFIGRWKKKRHITLLFIIIIENIFSTVFGNYCEIILKFAGQDYHSAC